MVVNSDDAFEFKQRMTPFENEIQNVKEKVLTGSLNSVPVCTILLSCVYQDSFAKWISNNIIIIITIIICDYSELIKVSLMKCIF